MAAVEATGLLRAGLIQCGGVHPDVAAGHGDYPALFDALLGPHGAELETFDVRFTDPPPVDACEAWVISGSADSAYDQLPWIPPVEAFLREAIASAVPLVAVCFGHQLLAQAMGGRVQKASSWGAGAHSYRVVAPVAGTDLAVGSTVRLVASHQDQVTALPDGATVVLSTDHCPNAGYTLGPAALSMQPHPEFTAELSGELTRRRRDRMGDDVSDAALASLDQPLDQDRVAGAMAGFLRDAVARPG